MSEERIEQAQSPRPQSPSKASTICDRGDSDSLQQYDLEEQGIVTPTRDRDDLLGTGTWHIPEEQSLDKKLLRAHEESAEDRRFLPLGKLRALVTPASVEEELRKHNLDASLAEDICRVRTYTDEHHRLKDTTCQKIFAILVLIGNVKLIGDFLDERVYDGHLPLTEVPTEQGNLALIRHGLTQMPSINYKLQEGQGCWTQANITHFETRQWNVSAPFFSQATDLPEKVHFYSLTSKDILPFIPRMESSRRHPYEPPRKRSYQVCGNSSVDRVRIHPDHHNFPTSQVRPIVPHLND